MLRRFIKDESGATAIEYGLIAALISIGIIMGARSIGLSIGTHFDTVSSTLDTSTP